MSKAVATKIIQIITEDKVIICQEIESKTLHRLRFDILKPRIIEEIKNNDKGYILVLLIDKNHSPKVSDRVTGRAIFNSLKKLTDLKKVGLNALTGQDLNSFLSVIQNVASVEKYLELIDPKINQVLEGFHNQNAQERLLKINFLFKSYSSTGFYVLRDLLKTVLRDHRVIIKFLGAGMYTLEGTTLQITAIKKVFESVEKIKADIIFN